MLLRYPMARSIRVGRFPLVEQLAAVGGEAILDRKERRGVSCAAQRADVGLSEILVLALQRIGKRRVLDQALTARPVQGEGRLALGLAAGVDGGERHVVEALPASRADVEDARHLREVR